jgi:hypothetical protein
MRSRRLFSILFAALVAGCATFGEGASRGLVDASEAAYARGDLETAYARAKQVRLEHPESRHRDQAFALACGSWKLLYERNRHVRPESPWVVSEPAFLFDWLASYFGETSPEEPANVLFVGVNYGVFRDFEAFARGRPALSGWRLVARDDNGIIREVTAERAEARAP